MNRKFMMNMSKDILRIYFFKKKLIVLVCPKRQLRTGLDQTDNKVAFSVTLYRVYYACGRII